MTATADIIDLAQYRTSRQPRDAKTMGAVNPMMVGWVPVWVMVPVPVMPMSMMTPMATLA